MRNNDETPAVRGVNPELTHELRNYALDLLAGTGIDLETVLNFPTGQTPPTPALSGDHDGDHDDLAAVLWAGWSAAARHDPEANPTQPALPGLDQAAAVHTTARTTPAAGGDQ